MSRRSHRVFGIVLLAMVWALAACAPAAPPRTQPADSEGGERPAAASRTLVMAVNTEVSTLSPKMLGPTNPERTTRIFSAGLSLVDARGEVRPYIAEALPQLNSDTWHVFPDGRMETTWRLRPGLAWHDGTPLTAEDFTFAFRVYTSPLGVFSAKPQDLMAQVVARDPTTLVITWSRSYPEAAQLTSTEFGPLPRHLLESEFAAYEQDPTTRDLFLARRYWTTEFVGNGPFRLTAWEAGAHMEGIAFDAHPLGRPKIDRVMIRFIMDDNVAFTNLLAESVHLSMIQLLPFEQGLLLEREWASNRRGVVIYQATSTMNVAIQHRPEYGHRALADLRVRRALAHGIDREGLNEALFSGKGPIVHSFVAPEAPIYPEVDRALVKYLYDPRRLEALMIEAGFRRDREGLFANEAGERFSLPYWVTYSTQLERQLAIMTDTWRQAGVEVQPYVIPGAQARDNQVRSTFPGLLGHGVSPATTSALETFSSDQIGSPSTRWGGQNRGGWSNHEYDRLLGAYSSTLDRAARNQHAVTMFRLMSEEVANYPLFRDLGTIVHLSIVKGPTGQVPEGLAHWNIHEWEIS
ncbi:MAG TPA: ABC transporter substrate-binding protein [Gemmatimonadales bacterium]|nr:ABC transporter substrate-binding protein [Gemmatimonadales bacterium]